MITNKSFEFVKSFLLIFLKYFSTPIDNLIDTVIIAWNEFITNVLFFNEKKAVHLW